MGEDKWLGRKLNTNTMMWEFGDKSGISLPEELRQEWLLSLAKKCRGSSLEAIGKVLAYKEEMEQKII